MRLERCTHCGTEFSPSTEGETFCCKGCEFVHGLIRREGLERFYDLRDQAVGLPVQDRPFQANEFGWLHEQQRLAELRAQEEDHLPTLRLHVRGLSCIGCVWLIEKLFHRTEGSHRADVFPSNGRLDLTWQAGSCDLSSFAAELQRFGYGLESFRDRGQDESELPTLTSRIGLCGAFALNSMVFTLPRYLGMDESFAFAGTFELISLISATFALLVGGSFFITRAWTSLRRRVLHIDLPIALGIVTAYLGSLLGWTLQADRLLYFDFVAIFTFLMLGGRYLHLAATEKIRNNLRGQQPLPDTVTRDDGSSLPLDELSSGDTYRIESAGVVPVASVLRNDSADVSLAWMTGEPAPVTIRAGHRIAAGAVNLNRDPIVLRAEEPLSSSLVAALAKQGDRPARSPLFESILKIYLGTVLLLAVLGGLWWSLTSRDPVTALQVALSILVVSCPCALGVAIPLLDQRATGALQRVGVFVQTQSLWHRIKRVRQILLDKTGTLTLERPQLRNPSALDSLPPPARRVLERLVSSSLHPLSRSLLEALGGCVSADSDLETEELPGLGLRTLEGPTLWSLGKPGWDGRDAAPMSSPTTANPSTDFRRNGELLARFEFAEEARPHAAEALRHLKEAHRIDASILSGDQDDRVKETARALGLDSTRAHGGLSPGDKEELVQTLNQQDVLYLGDGANDSLAFDAASVTGTPALDRSVLDTKADFFFTSRGLDFLPHLLLTARWRHRTIFQVLLFAIVYNLVAISICLAGLMSPLLAAILMPLSSLACLALAARPLPSATLPLIKPHPSRDPAPPPGPLTPVVSPH